VFCFAQRHCAVLKIANMTTPKATSEVMTGVAIFQISSAMWVRAWSLCGADYSLSVPSVPSVCPRRENPEPRFYTQRELMRERRKRRELIFTI
jgi:hypothetical protein